MKKYKPLALRRDTGYPIQVYQQQQANFTEVVEPEWEVVSEALPVKEKGVTYNIEKVEVHHHHEPRQVPGPAQATPKKPEPVNDVELIGVISVGFCAVVGFGFIVGSIISAIGQ